MTKITKDPLLGSARILLAILIGLCALGIVLLIITVGAVLTVLRAEALEALTQADAPASAIWAIAAVVAMMAGLLALAFQFFRELYAIVGTVDQRDPFQPENGDRLARMGWLATAAQVLGIPIMALVGWFNQYTPDDGHIDMEVGISGSGILLVLTLFILARVFRQGAAMREELEGTV